jgi:hypothetical protein
MAEKVVVNNSDWGYKVADSGIGLSHQATLAGWSVRQPYARVGYIPQSGTKNLATDCQEKGVATRRDKDINSVIICGEV